MSLLDFSWRMPTTGARPLIADGTIEALKWLALVSMTYDHVVRFLFSGSGIGEATAFGRIALPLFAFILAYNLSRPGITGAVYIRVIGRLITFGLLAVPAYYYLVGPFPINILFTLALALGIVWCLEHRRQPLAWAALVLLLPLSLVVEYGLLGIITTLSLFVWCRSDRDWQGIVALALGFGALALSNGNLWCLMALPFFFLAERGALALKRSKWLFYTYYPAHLSVIALIHFFWLR